MKTSLILSNRVGFWGLTVGVLAIAVLCGPGSHATAAPPQPLTMTGDGDGIIVSPGHFAFMGVVTGKLLGPMTFEGTSYTTGPDPAIRGNELVVGAVVFTAANGDELHATVVG